MNTVRSAVAVLALVSGAVAITSGEAWARDPDKEIPVERSAVSTHDPATPITTSDRTRVDVVQAGAPALGGAGVACGAMWVYRRRARLAG